MGWGRGGSQNVLKDTVVHFACKIVRDGLLGIHLFGPGALPRDSLVRRNGPAIDEPVPTSQFPELPGPYAKLPREERPRLEL